MKKTLTICTMIFSISSFHTLDCMDTPEDKSQKKELSVWRSKRRSGRSNEVLKKKSASSFRKSASLSDLPEHKEFRSPYPFIYAIRNENDDLLHRYLHNKYLNPNEQDEDGNTALHHAAIQRNKKFITALLQDPRVDASLVNKKKQTAREAFTNLDPMNPTPKEVGVRISIFARITLDIAVKQQMPMQNDYFSSTITATIVNTIIEMIKEKFKHFQTQKNNAQALPESALLPEYATDEFIKDMIDFRIAQYALHNTNK